MCCKREKKPAYLKKKSENTEKVHPSSPFVDSYFGVIIGFGVKLRDGSIKNIKYM